MDKEKGVVGTKIFFPEEDIDSLCNEFREILESGYLTLGKYGEEFEKEFANYTGTKYGVSVSSGTSAIEIVLRSIGVKGCSVVIPTNTFAATGFAVIHAGGKIVFADIGNDLCMSAESLSEQIKENTKVVVLVHVAGIISPDINKIREICEEKGIILIEDAAHAHGSCINGKKSGSLGKAGCFSFYPTKVMTSGEGGMITTNDEQLYKKAIVFRDQGKRSYSENIHVELGANHRMSELHAAIGIKQFKRMEKFVENRKMVAKIYDNGLKGVSGVELIDIPQNVESNYYKYVVLLKGGIDRSEVKKRLKEEFGVGCTGEVYELPLHLQPVFKEITGNKEGDFPVAEDLCKRQICLPMTAVMTKEDAIYVVESLKKVLL